ncbi:hypothetical protein SEA_DEJAVU_28 [Microbacterium Phage DejaVu]|nr:hypothetical protein SEA_HUBBS_27 [Microbacterium phage Hubbs]WNM66160.1 hypothetical protein SEA_DEJAVU_28 [Microbacterium Phage DejaVu]
MSYKMLQVSEEIIFHTEGLNATILVDGEEYVSLGRDDLGAISEWLAVAWENVSGEEYKPVIITERGYVVDHGSVPIEDAVEIATRLPRTVRVERDCE